MNNSPEISVIVPVYKVEEYLDQCIESIIKQSFTNYELILVDDGSPDRCPSICDKWKEKDDRIIVVHQKNQGLSAARNSGISIARGNYLTFIDSDDWISFTMLEDLYSLITKNKADISICNFVKTSDRNYNINEIKENEKVSIYNKEEFMKIILRINSNRCIHYAWAKLYTRSVIDQNEHYPVGMLNEDVEGMFKAVIASTKIVETSKIGYYYYENTESISRKKFGKNFLCLIEVWQRILELSKAKAPKYTEYVNYNLMRSDFTILVDSIKFGDIQTDKEYVSECKEIRLRLKSNIHKLLKSPMKFNRKVMMIFVCYFYSPVKFLIRRLLKRNM